MRRGPREELRLFDDAPSRVSTTYWLTVLNRSTPQSAKKMMMSSAGTSPTKM